MTCSACGLAEPRVSYVDWSAELDAVVCDGCYQRAKTSSAAWREFFDNVRAAQAAG